MDDFAIFFLIGLGVSLAGFLLLRHENKIFKDCIETTATVFTYYDYINTTDSDDTIRNRITMYTMAVEYSLTDGTLIQASEQSGSASKKYPVGTKLKILYTRENPRMFVVRGDHSRKIVMAGMVFVGAAMMVVAFLMLF